MSTKLEITPGPAKYGRVVAIKRTGEDAEGVPFPLCKLTCIVGRSEEADIRLQLASVSLQHCILNVDPETEQVSLETFATVIPSYLNESPLDRNSKVPLKHGDLISVANRRFRFEYLPPNFTPKQVSSTPQNSQEASKAVECAPEASKTLSSAPHSQTREIIVKIFTPLAKPPLSGILRRRSSKTPAILKPETSPQLAPEPEDAVPTELDTLNSTQTVLSDPEQPISIASQDVVTSDVTVEVQATPPEAEEGADSQIEGAEEDPILIQSTPAGKRVSFGPYLSPEQYDSKLPPVTPVKKGAMPSRTSLTRNQIVSTTATLVEEEIEDDEDLEKSEIDLELQIEEQEVETDESVEVLELSSPDLFDSPQTADELSPEKTRLSDDTHPDSLREDIEHSQADISALNESSSNPVPELSGSPPPEAPVAQTTSTLLLSPKLKPAVVQNLSPSSPNLQTNQKDESDLEKTLEEPSELSESNLETLETQLERPEPEISPENVPNKTENVNTSEIDLVLTVEDEDTPIVPKSASNDDAPDVLSIQDVISSSTPELTEVSVNLEDKSEVSDSENPQSDNVTDKQTSVVQDSDTDAQKTAEEPLEERSDPSPGIVQLIFEPESEEKPEEEPEREVEIEEEAETEVETENVVENPVEEAKTEEMQSETSPTSSLSSHDDVTPPAEALVRPKKSNRREKAAKSTSPALEGVAELFNTPVGAKTMKGRRLTMEEPTDSPFRRSRRILVQSTTKEPVVTIRRLTDEQVTAIQTELKQPVRGLAKQRAAKGLALAVLEAQNDKASTERSPKAERVVAKKVQVEDERAEEVQPKRKERGRPRNVKEASIEPEPPAKKSKTKKTVPVVEFPQDVTVIEETPTKNLRSASKSVPKARAAIKGHGKATKTTPSVVVVSPNAGRNTRGRGAAAKKVAVPVEEHEEEEEKVSVRRSSPRKAHGSSKKAMQEAPSKKVVPKEKQAEVKKKEESEDSSEKEESCPIGAPKRGTTAPSSDVVVAPRRGKRIAKKITQEDGATPPKRESATNLPKRPQVPPVEQQTKTSPKRGQSTKPKGTAKKGKEEADIEEQKKVAVTPKAKRDRPTRKSKEESEDEEVKKVKKVAVSPKAKRARPTRKGKEEENEDEEEVEKVKKVAVSPKAKHGRPKRKNKEEENGDEEEVEEVKKVAVSTKAKRGQPMRKGKEEESEDEEEVEEMLAKKTAKGNGTRAKKIGKTTSKVNAEWTALDDVEMARQRKGHAAHLQEEKVKSQEDSVASPRRNLRRKAQFDLPIEATPPSKRVKLARK